MSLLIETHNLCKTLGGHLVVNRINLQVERGDVYGLLGENGSGKSTTLRMLLGLVWPSSGKIALRGFELPKYREIALRKTGAIVEAPAFYDYLSGRENLAIFSGLSGYAPRSRIEEVLDWVHLSGRENDPVRVYSHGMRQRLGLAQALLPRPELLVLDEPTDGLDPQGLRDVRELLLELSQKRGMTTFLSSHLLPEVERLCNRIGIIHQGKLLYQGSVRDLVGRELQFRIKTDRPEEALRFLSSRPDLRACQNGDGCLSVRLSETDIAALNETLVLQGFRVFEISPYVPSLEDIYFRFTRC